MPTSAEAALYLDSSAIVKLVVVEKESEALRRWLRQRHDRQLVSSALARTEVPRAVFEADLATRNAADDQLRAMVLPKVTTQVLDDASLLPPAVLRNLDAIHLATARVVELRLEAVVTYDHRMVNAARSLGLPVAHPGVRMG